TSSSLFIAARESVSEKIKDISGLMDHVLDQTGDSLIEWMALSVLARHLIQVPGVQRYRVIRGRKIDDSDLFFKMLNMTLADDEDESASEAEGGGQESKYKEIDDF